MLLLSTVVLFCLEIKGLELGALGQRNSLFAPTTTTGHITYVHTVWVQ